MSFKDRLKDARVSKKLTQEQLGVFINVAKSTVAGYERGSSEPDMMKLQKIMATLDVDANYLFQDEMKEINKIPMKEREPYLNADEQNIVQKYRALNEVGRHKADDYINDLADNPKYQTGNEPHKKKITVVLERALSESMGITDGLADILKDRVSAKHIDK